MEWDMATLQRGLLGLSVALACAVSPFVTADNGVSSESVTPAPQATQSLRPGDQLRAQARRSLFVEFPELYPAIQRGGAFGGSWSNAIATDIFARSEQGIADAKRLSTITEVAPKTWLIGMPLVNVVVFETSEGLVLVDAGTAAEGPAIADLLKSVSDAPIHTIIYTHAHSDHAFGTWALLDDDPQIVATADLVTFFDQLRRLRGSFAKYLGQPVSSIPEHRDDLVYPTRTFNGDLTLTIGGEEFVLRARRGETFDQLYVWVPSRSALAAADYYQGFLPNAGNGKRIQRHPEEWAFALREMAAEQPNLLLPAHGEAVSDPKLIQTNLVVLAEMLEVIAQQTIDQLNSGTRKDLIPSRLDIPDYLLSHPTLEAKYVSHEDISRMVIKQYTGWWNDIPSHWSPATFDQQARTIVALAGGTQALIAKAYELMETDIVMASHVTDWAWYAAPDDPEVQSLVIDNYRARILDPEANTQEMLAYLEVMAAARARQLMAQ